MKGSRFKLNQNHAPIHEALETFRRMRVVPFDVPGHKRGRGNPELTEFLGQKCVGVDVNSMKPLDNLCHPVSVIREAWLKHHSEVEEEIFIPAVRNAGIFPRNRE